METFITFMERTLSKENTLLRAKFQLSFIVRTKMRPTSTTKNLEKGVIGDFS
jgi:hypothetical protein